MNISLHTPLIAFLAISTLPAQIVTTDLQLHYTPGDIVTSGSNVTGWANSGLSGTSGSLAQGTVSAQPTIISSALNGFDVVSFNDTSDVLSVADNATLSTAFDSPSGLSFVAVVKWDALVGTRVLSRTSYSTGAGTTPLDMITVGDDLYAQSRDTANAARPSILTDFATAPTDWAVVTGVWNAGTDTVTVWFGNIAATPNTSATATPVAFSSFALGLNTISPDAEIAEVLMYNSALSNTDVLQNVSALEGKYAIPENSTYATLIGIGVMSIALAARLRRKNK